MSQTPPKHREPSHKAGSVECGRPGRLHRRPGRPGGRHECARSDFVRRRRPDGETGSLLVRERGDGRCDRVGWTRWPLARGIASLVEEVASTRQRGAALLGRPVCLLASKRQERQTAAKARKSATLGALGALCLFLLSVNDGAPASPPPATKAEGAAGKGAGLVMLLIVVGFFIALPTPGRERAA